MRHLQTKTTGKFSRSVAIMLAVLLTVSMAAVAFTATNAPVASAAENEPAHYQNVPVDEGKDNSDDAFWVDATYYDYLSNSEMDNGWLNPIQAGTGYEGAEDNWYPFNNFNSFISRNAGSWTYPLYIGNFCNTYDAYDYSNHGGPYTTATAGLTRFDYVSNNSNGLKSYNTAIQGLAAKSLDSSGTIMGSGSSTKMPYFDNELLMNNNMAKVITSSFPFRHEEDGNVTTYSFDSRNAKDNVFFKWNGTTPVSVGYGRGTSYGVKDGLGKFMDDEASGYGIFPFNNTGVTGSGRGGNSNLDYGFGIKLNIDFKVPENGLLSNGQPVKFTYLGDDDLWVYISESDGSNSQLVLDLGGAHKMAGGSIDFSTMRATANSVVNAGTTSTDKGLYLYDNYGWGNNMRVWAWNSSGQDGWFYPTYDSATKTYYVSSSAIGSNGTPLSSMTDFKVAKGNWEAQTDQETTLSNHYNRITYLDNLGYAGGNTVIPTVAGETKINSFGFESNGAGGYKPLDAGKTYRMTIFYMERGLIESNNYMSFTLTPAENDIDVKNTVKTADINPGLLSVIGNETFHYTLASSDGQKTTSADIKSGQTANFGGEFETGTKLTVSQTVSSKLKYSTEYIVRDVMSGDELHRGNLTEDVNGNMTDEFTLINGATGKDYDKAHIFVEFINTPLVAPMTVSKKIVDENGNEVNDVIDIEATLYLDFGDGLKTYNDVEYTVSGETGTKKMSGGKISFKSNQTVTILGLFQGADYRIVESQISGYEIVAGTFNGTINTNNSVVLQNKKSQLDATVKAIKTLDGKNYTGGLFEFTLTELFGDGRSKTISEISDGEITFKPDKNDKFLVFSEADTYSYKLVETRVTDNNYISDITTDSTVYYVDVVVAPNPDNDNKLEAKVLYKTSANANGEEEIPTFANKIKEGSATVIKYNQAKDKTIDDTEFTLYKVTSGTDTNLTDMVQTLKTGKNGQKSGQVKFENLDIYEAGFNPDKDVAPKYQWYCIVESASATGYSKNETKIYFQIPQEGVYNLEFSYQNGKIFSPTTAGEGMQIFKTIGITLSVLALLLLAAYVYRSRRYTAKYAK